MNNYFEWIDQYLRGSLSDEQSALFEAELSKNEQLQKELKNKRLLLTGLVRWQHGQFKKTVETFNAQDNQESQAQSSKSNVVAMNSRKKYLALAAAVLALVVMSSVIYNYFNLNYSNEQLYSTYFTLPEVEVFAKINTVKGGNNLQDSAQLNQSIYEAWTQAKKDYQENRFSEALDLVNKMDTSKITPEEKAELLYFKGLLYLQTEQWDDAKTVFQNDSLIDPTGRQWYLAMIDLKTENNLYTVKTQFESIAKDETNPYQTKAQEIIDKLDQ